jgi:hypothetical protein
VKHSPKVEAYIAGASKAGGAGTSITCDDKTIAVNLPHGRCFDRVCSEVELLFNPAERARLDVLACAAETPEPRRMPRKAGKAWAKLLASTRSTDHGAQLFVDAYEAGRRDAVEAMRKSYAADPFALFSDIAKAGEP